MYSSFKIFVVLALFSQVALAKPGLGFGFVKDAVQEVRDFKDDVKHFITHWYSDHESSDGLYDNDVEAPVAEPVEGNTVDDANDADVAAPVAPVAPVDAETPVDADVAAIPADVPQDAPAVVDDVVAAQ